MLWPNKKEKKNKDKDIRMNYGITALLNSKQHQNG